MDCEKFDRVMLDLFYEELDEITSAAARRHTEHCTRCRDISNKLRATREVGALPLVDPPPGLVDRILAAERRARAELPARQRFGRAISVLAGYAMRPQLAMAALLLLVIGSSLLLLRGQPGEQKTLLVTERGAPESEAEAVAVLPLRERDADAVPPAGAPAAAPSEAREAKLADRVPDSERAREESETLSTARAAEADRAYEDALAAYRDRRYEVAQRRFEGVVARGGANAASAALYAAQSARARSGCAGALPLYGRAYERFPDVPPGQEAAWLAAGCHRAQGDFDQAKRLYEALLHRPGFADRAQAALASLGTAESEPPRALADSAKRRTQPSAELARPASTRPAAGAAAARAAAPAAAKAAPPANADE